MAYIFVYWFINFTIMSIFKEEDSSLLSASLSLPIIPGGGGGISWSSVSCLYSFSLNSSSYFSLSLYTSSYLYTSFLVSFLILLLILLRQKRQRLNRSPSSSIRLQSEGRVVCFLTGDTFRKTIFHWPSLTDIIKPFLKGRYSTTILLSLAYVCHLVEPTSSYLLTLYS